MSVYELSREQLDELKEAYYVELSDSGEADEVLDGIGLLNTNEIPDDIIFTHYDGVCFTCDDFFCTAGQY